MPVIAVDDAMVVICLNILSIFYCGRWAGVRTLFAISHCRAILRNICQIMYTEFCMIVRAEHALNSRLLWVIEKLS